MQLTPRALTILVLIAKGLTQAQVVERLRLHPAHVGRCMKWANHHFGLTIKALQAIGQQDDPVAILAAYVK